ncbi:ABC transporter permease [Paenibacillus sp. ACRRX]|uniref:ABC transporter permease n=1 Tax=Paenibacillus sp. ACRRX TaxID=2918206 RepID=UPI001EF70788|nr:ABC transporter permease [Paenibacillus sp. ACRRX]MCG7409169.1 ABC transporter permease [Paenibacillus sp. ACRRX]
MSNAQRALLVAAGLFLTIALITLVVNLFTSAQDASKEAQSKFSDLQTELSQTEFSIYDNTTLSGSQVLNTIRKYMKKDQFGVQVTTAKSAGSSGNSSTFYGNTFTDTGEINNPQDRNVKLDTALDETLNSYINPSGKFKGTVIRDGNNVVRGIQFQQAP